jgi:hypothetical protein
MFAHMKEKAKRKLRGYKVADKPYIKAMKRANKEKESLATLIEQFVIRYSLGMYWHSGNDGNITEQPKD